MYFLDAHIQLLRVLALCLCLVEDYIVINYSTNIIEGKDKIWKKFIDLFVLCIQISLLICFTN